MFESRKAPDDGQQEFWVDTCRLPQVTAISFHGKLDEATPDHSSLRVIRRRLGIDPSVTETNAPLRELAHRNTKERYWESVGRQTADEDDFALEEVEALQVEQMR